MKSWSSKEASGCLLDQPRFGRAEAGVDFVIYVATSKKEMTAPRSPVLAGGVFLWHLCGAKDGCRNLAVSESSWPPMNPMDPHGPHDAIGQP